MASPLAWMLPMDEQGKVLTGRDGRRSVHTDAASVAHTGVYFEGKLLQEGILGGPGQNPTTDKRIFNLSAAAAATPSACRTKVRLLEGRLAWIVAKTIQC
jgi:hypothetical protein